MPNLFDLWTRGISFVGLVSLESFDEGGCVKKFEYRRMFVESSQLSPILSEFGTYGWQLVSREKDLNSISDWDLIFMREVLSA